MQCKFTNRDIFNLVNHQLKQFWGGVAVLLDSQDADSVTEALNRTEQCFKQIRSDYFHHKKEVVFHISHSIQYMVFLYYLSNCLYLNKKEEKASFIYYLNKAMNSVELFYSVALPKHFCAEHPLGTVLGKAQYGDHFFVYQGCTVGGNLKGNKIYYPVIGEYVTMYSDSKILGNCHIGDNVIIAANTYIKDMDIPAGSIVFGTYPDIMIKSGREDKIKQVREHLWNVSEQ